MAERPWSRHYFDGWQTKAGNPQLPHWLRVAASAYGAHDDDGHARFKRGELSTILGHIDPDSGAFVRYGNLSRAIAEAVEYRWLAPGSYWGCLIVPAHDIRKGDLSRRSGTCPLAAKHETEACKHGIEARRLHVVRAS